MKTSPTNHAKPVGVLDQFNPDRLSSLCVLMNVPTLSLTARNVLSPKSSAGEKRSTVSKSGWVGNLSTIAEANCRKWVFSPLQSSGPLGTVAVSIGNGTVGHVNSWCSENERVLRELDVAIGQILFQVVALTEFARNLGNVFVPAFLGDMTEIIARCRRQLTLEIERELKNSRMTGSPVPIIAGQTTQPGNQNKERK